MSLSRASRCPSHLIRRPLVSAVCLQVFLVSEIDLDAAGLSGRCGSSAEGTGCGCSRGSGMCSEHWVRDSLAVSLRRVLVAFAC